MKRLILHIGYPRTATTWFQKRFFPFVKNFEYISDSYNFVYGFEKIKKYPNRLIISNEEITAIKLGGEVDIAFMLNRMKNIIDYYDRIDCLVIVRRQDDIIRSAYTYYIQSGGYYNFDKYWKRMKRINKIRQWKYYSYLQALEQYMYKDFFLHIFPYEDFAKNNNDFIKKLSSRLQIDVDFHKINYKPRNSSPSLLSLAVVRRLNRFFYGYVNPYNNRLAEELGIKTNKKHIKGIRIPIKIIIGTFNLISFSKFDLSHVIKKDIWNTFKEENRKLDEKYHLGLKEYGYY